MLPMEIYPVARVEADVEAFAWAYAEAQAAAFDLHWEGLRAREPALFNGRVLLMHGWRREKDVLRTRHFETDFKNFLGWRDFGFADASVRNCFSMAALRGADGGYVLGVMGEHTSNAGQIYFPAGTPDLADVTDSRLDLEGSALRELEEETGVDPSVLHIEDGWSIADAGPRLGCMKMMTAREDCEALAARIAQWLARQERPELAGLHIVRSRSDILPARMPDFMAAWLEAMLPG